MAEMDNYNNPYCGFNANGSSRGASHSPREFRRAWKRIALILSGGNISPAQLRDALIDPQASLPL